MIGAAAGTGVAAAWHFGRIAFPTLIGIITAAFFTAAGTGCDDYTGGAAIWGFLLGYGVAHAVKRLFPGWQ